MDEQTPDQETPEQEPAEMAPPALIVPMASLGLDPATLKPGAVIELKVNAIHGDSVELEPVEDDEDEESDMPSDEDAKTMPLDELESKLPQAER